MMNKLFYFLIIIITIGVSGYVVFSYYRNDEKLVYFAQADSDQQQKSNFLRVDILREIEIKPEETVKHIETPEHVRAIYMSSWVGSSKSIRSGLVDFMIHSDINALVLDIKDYSGVIAFDIDDAIIDSYRTDSSRIPDIRDFIDQLHSHNIYVIGRVTLFQDPLLAQRKPELAFKRKDNGDVWKDKKGLAFIDPKKTEAHEYFARIAEKSYEIGFDEINFDYVRYPSDGNISNLNYNLATGERKTDIMKSFYGFLDTRLRSKNIPISADLFGMTTINTDDLSIGQYLEDALLHFDYVAPMVYPSHYPNGFRGYSNPAEHPYAIVYDAMKNAVRRAENIGLSGDHLRTWIQDFNLGAQYDMKKIQDQIRASYDTGVHSYMVWDPSNKYTRAAYLIDLEHNYENNNE